MRGYIMGSIHFGILIFLLFLVLGTTGTIKIERPYRNEYNQCKSELKQMEKEFICPEVKCVQGIVGIMWSIIGFLAMAFGMLFFWYSNSRYEKVNEELKEREKVVTKAEAELYKKSLKGKPKC